MISELEDVLSPRELESLRQGYRERVTDTHLPAISDLPAALPKLFAQAARRAQAAGFDGVELHMLMPTPCGAFLSATNTAPTATAAAGNIGFDYRSRYMKL